MQGDCMLNKENKEERIIDIERQNDDATEDENIKWERCEI